jgi:outer membrane protein
MKKIILIISLATVHINLYAQNLSITQAIENANDIIVRQSHVESEIQAINLKIQKSKRLPLIYGDGNIQRNIITPVTPVPAIAFNPNAKPEEVLPLKFATDWSAKAGLQLSFDLFNPQNKANIRNASLQYKKTKIDNVTSKQELRNTIIDLYSQAYLAQEQLDIAIINETNYQASYDIIEARYNAGRATLIDKNNATKKLLELVQNREEAQLVLRNKYILLSQYLDINTFDNLSSNTDEISEFITNKNTNIAQLELDTKIKAEQLRLLSYDALPKVTLNAFLGTQHFSNDLDLFNHQLWYGNSYVNLTLRLPISEAYERSLRRAQYKKEYELAIIKYNDANNTDNISQIQYQNEIVILQKKMASLKQTQALLEQNINIIKSQIEEGKVLITDLNKEIETLQEHNKKIWQTAYDIIQKKLSLTTL